MLYHFVLTLQASSPYGQQTQSLNGTINMENKTRSEALAELRAIAVESHGEHMREAVILFFSIEPDTIPSFTKETVQ